jgi:hypothetical protein
LLYCTGNSLLAATMGGEGKKIEEEEEEEEEVDKASPWGSTWGKEANDCACHTYTCVA